MTIPRWLLYSHRRERISQPYRFELELVSERPDLDLHSLLHLPAFLAFSSAGPGIHGLIFQVAQGESGQRLTRYTLSMVPQLSYLDLRSNQRCSAAHERGADRRPDVAEARHRRRRLPIAYPLHKRTGPQIAGC